MDEKTTNTGTQSAGCFVCNTVLPFFRNLVPQDTKEHFRNSGAEFLKGVRTLIDHEIAHLRQEPKGTHVTVE